MKLPSTILLAAVTTLGGLYATPEASAQSRSSSSVTITSRGRLGAQVMGISEHLRRHFGAPAHAGLLVDHVLADSPAAKAGLKTGDVIVRVADHEIAEVWDIFSALGNSKKGDKANLKIIRNKKPKTLQVILDDDPSRHSMRWGDLNSPFPQRPNWGGGGLFPGGKNFPFGPMVEGLPKELQEKIRTLEERLEKLEGKGTRAPAPKTGKPAKRLKGAASRTGKQS